MLRAVVLLVLVGCCKGVIKNKEYTAEEKAHKCVEQPKGTDYCGISVQECTEGQPENITPGDDEILCPKARKNPAAMKEIICHHVHGTDKETACFCPDKYRDHRADGSSVLVCADVRRSRKHKYTEEEKKNQCVEQPKGTDYCGESIHECVEGYPEDEIPGDDEILCPKARKDREAQKEIICHILHHDNREMACFCPDKYRNPGSDGASDKVCGDSAGRKR